MRAATKRRPPDPVFERILAAMDAKGVTQKDVTEYLGMTSAGFTKWRNRENRSFMKYLPQLSEILGVSADYLLSE